MPKKGNYIALVVLGFLLGIVWGIYGITQYSPMVKAIEAGDETEAWTRAKRIKTATLIGAAVNILYLFYMMTQR